MRYAAIAANLVLIGAVIGSFATQGMPDGGEWLLVAIVVAAPILSLIALFPWKSKAAPQVANPPAVQ